MKQLIIAHTKQYKNCEEGNRTHANMRHTHTHTHKIQRRATTKCDHEWDELGALLARSMMIRFSHANQRNFNIVV